MTARQWRIVKATTLSGAMAARTGIALGLLAKFGRTWSMPATVVGIGVVMAAGLALTTPWWRSIDDAARDAHKTAWYWGGSFGAGVGVIAALLFGGGSASPLARGAMLVFGLEVAGYVVVWAGWWLVRRPAATA